ncbi:hypothetical protein RMO59_35855, partial [Streptomyces alfalfae]
MEPSADTEIGAEIEAAAPRHGAADPVKALMRRHHDLCARAVDPLEIAAGLEALLALIPTLLCRPIERANTRGSPELQRRHTQPTTIKTTKTRTIKSNYI